MRTPLAAAALLLTLVACGKEEKVAPAAPPLPGGHILVDHILIGVSSARFPQGKRPEPEARVFARSLYDKLRGGDDWAAAKRQHSEDPPPGGPYGLADFGVRPGPEEFPREQMAPAFGDVGFALAVGEIGLAEYHPDKSPFGFHIVKRVR
jgi:hypothetical protein